ncbi:MAG TPA: hypothetical protein VES68_01040 [Candidatus Sulfotelmatobacter sp.]|nr:hypothetical protein [Candidatus Sulfotelmatobacter sp.]
MPNLRELIGAGREHEVFKSNRDGWVLKRPKGPILTALVISGFGPQKVTQELKEAEDLISSSQILRSPETRVFPFGRGYVIAQRFVEEDGSVEDVRAKLKEEGQKLMANRYSLAHGNFINSNGHVYLIDHSHAFYRIGERLGFKFEDITSIRTRTKRYLKRKLQRLTSLPEEVIVDTNI